MKNTSNRIARARRPAHLPPPTPAGQRGLSRPRLLMLLALAAVLAGLGGWAWKQRAPADAPGGPAAGASAPAGAASGTGAARRFGGANRVQPVTVASVRRQAVNVTVAAIGNIAALNTAVVRTRVDGELRRLLFTEGQTVKAGQLLAEIDPRAYEVALAQAQGQLARDTAQLQNAQIDLDRYKDLLAKDSIARQQVDTQEALVRQLKGTVQADQAQVDNARLQLSYTRVTAPIGGRLGLRLVDLGNMVRAGDANGLVTITQTQPISVVFAVPETHLAQISRKLKAGQPLAVQAWDREQRSLLSSGKVITTDNAIDTATGTIKVKASFANADGTLFPNQFVNIRLQLDTLADALVVPTNAVQRGAQGTFVYVVKDDGSVTMRRVRLGAVDGDWVKVDGELQPGEKVVTDGADRLREGAKVEVIAAPATRGGGGSSGGGGAAVAASAPAPAPAPAPAGSGDATRPALPAKKPPSADAAPQPATPSPAATAPAAPAATGERPPWLDRLPPEVQERFLKMNPEERKAFIERLRERRRQREADGG